MSTINFICPFCQHSMQGPQTLVGQQVSCPNCHQTPVVGAPVQQPGYAPPMQQGQAGIQDASSKKTAAGICGILFGGLGVHKFVLGYNTAGIIMLLVTLLTCGFGAIVMGVVGLIEGIIYLTKADDEFYHTYMAGEKQWF